MAKNSKKGFTLAELLIVVAIIGVLVAIAIPVFSGKLDDARLTADTANVRSKYEELVAEAILNDDFEDDVAPYIEISMAALESAITNQDIVKIKRVHQTELVPIPGTTIMAPKSEVEIYLEKDPAKSKTLVFSANVSLVE